MFDVKEFIKREDFNRPRAESIKILQEAVKEKTLACYDMRVYSCLYYHKETEKCCAVGALIDFKGKTLNNNVSSFLKDVDGPIEDHISDIQYHMDENGMENTDLYFGLTRYELEKLQRYHDQVINKRKKNKDGILENNEEHLWAFESFVNKLTA